MNIESMPILPTHTCVRGIVNRVSNIETAPDGRAVFKFGVALDRRIDDADTARRYANCVVYDGGDLNDLIPGDRVRLFGVFRESEHAGKRYLNFHVTPQFVRAPFREN